MSDTAIKISDLPRASSIKEKDFLPFSTSLLTGTESTQAIPLSVLRLFLQNPTVYATAALAAADTKSGDYVLVYTDNTKISTFLYYNNGSTVSQVTDQNGNNIIIHVPKNFSGNTFSYTATASEVLTLPEWLVGTKGYRRIIVHSSDDSQYYGEYIITKMTASNNFTMSQNAVERENYQGAFTFTWDSLSSIQMTFKFAGAYTIRIY